MLTNPSFDGKIVVMTWEHKHIANEQLEKSYPNERVTLRQLLKIDDYAKGHPDEKIPETWSGDNYDFFWIVDYADPRTPKPSKVTIVKQTFPRLTRACRPTAGRRPSRRWRGASSSLLSWRHALSTTAPGNSRSPLPKTCACASTLLMPLLRLVALCAFLLLAALAPARAGNTTSTIPLSLTQSDWGGGRIFVTARFGSIQGPMRLDTGASTTRMMLAPWNRDWPVLGRSASTGSSGKTISCDDVEAQNVLLPAEQGDDVGRAKLLVTRCAAGEGDLLGLNFFKGARFSLDFEKRALTFFPPAQPNAKPRPFRRLTPEQSLVGIDLRLGRAAAIGFLDTGAELSAVDRVYVATHMPLFTLVKRRVGASGASGGNFSPDLYKIKVIDLGDGLVLRDVYALVYDFGVLRAVLGRGAPVILGYNFVSRLQLGSRFFVAGRPDLERTAKVGDVRKGGPIRAARAPSISPV